MGLHSETFEENELFADQLKCSNTESQPAASAVHQECLANSVSMSSGYGTYSAVEMSPGKCKDIQMCVENTEEVTKGQKAASSVQENLVTASIQNTECSQTTVEHCPLLKDDDIVFPAEFEHMINEGQCGKTNCKSLTSWAQKLKQNQVKRINAKEGDAPSVQGEEQTQAFALEDVSYQICTHNVKIRKINVRLHSFLQCRNLFLMYFCFLGLTYWKLDEKEMYHTLPENLGNEFCTLPTKMSSEQVSFFLSLLLQEIKQESKPSSLKDIYHKKQRESKQLPDWNLSPLQSTHPPEVIILTLDPTLHMKPGQQNPGLPLYSFDGTPERVSFSPDSMADPGFFIHSDTDSFLHTSTITSPPSAGSPKYSSYPSNEILNVDDEDNLTLTPSSAAQSQIPAADNSLPECSISVTCVEDPVVFSKIRQNLREKHARHIADLRAYYDSEIQSLKQQLEASHKPPSEDLKKINQKLADRCSQLEAALNEANNRTRGLENKNNTLEVEVADWRERFSAVTSTTKALQERVEEMRSSSKEKDNTISRLKRRLKDLEEAFEKAYKLSDNKDARLKEENKMFQNLLGEYESLGKEHERVKDSLNITENKLLDAHTQISDLKRTVSKLEAQIKQLEHENLLKFRHLADSHFRTSYVNKLASCDVSRRKWLIPGSEYSIFTGQPLEAQGSPKDNREVACSQSPPEKDSSSDPSLTNETAKKESKVPETPVMKAFRELEERKAVKNWGTQTSKEEEEVAAPTMVGFDETALGSTRSPEKSKDHVRHKRYSPPGGQRSSSLPPSNRKPNTPTTREIMLAPVTVTYSPKRSPKENLSPGFSQLLRNTENMTTRFDILLDDLETAPRPAAQYSNPWKRLEFRSVGDAEGTFPQYHASPGKASSAKPPPLRGGAKAGVVGTAWEEEGSTHGSTPCLSSSSTAAPYEADFKYVSRIKTLAETERLFDELTHEKQQIEAQLSRIPCAGGRMTLQARLNQEALEDRLERINRELGSIRMILKRFHILRTSANI
uniref:M-phase phosphoprotein 9 n=1 Tax=Varanus komodoensis TaxID=61221 RepID=A0A8D2LDA4_VARKO